MVELTGEKVVGVEHGVGEVAGAEDGVAGEFVGDAFHGDRSV